MLSRVLTYSKIHWDKVRSIFAQVSQMMSILVIIRDSRQVITTITISELGSPNLGEGLLQLDASN